MSSYYLDSDSNLGRFFRRLLVLALLSCHAALAGTFTTNIAVNTAIPDNSTLGLASRIELPPNLGIVTNVRVSLVVTGGWNGDLYGYLSHGPHLAVLLNRVGRDTNNAIGYGDRGFGVTFDDAATNGDVHVYRQMLHGSHAIPLAGALTNTWEPDARATPPHSALATDPRTAPLGVFQGANAGGAWTLFLADLERFDRSTLLNWTLELETETGVTFAAPPDVATVADPGQCSAAAVGLGDPFIGVPYLNIVSNPPPPFTIGVTEVVWTVTLTDNETLTDTQRVTVVDAELPLLALPADVATSLAPGQCSITNLNLGTPTASDNCSLASVTNDAPTVFFAGVTPVIWTATDIHGNWSSRTQWVTVSDPLLTCPSSYALRPRITEFMTANGGGLRDADGETTDWIEIHNPGTNSVSLSGWHLTDEAGNLTKWTFPATNLAPGGYLVVFASGKDRSVAGAELHANFRLDQGGQYLALVFPDGLTVSHAFTPLYPQQRENISYGLVVASTNPLEYVERYFMVSTPGGVNTNGYLGLVSDTKFDHDRGFYDTPFSLSITCATVGASIYFTTNGSAPSPTNGFLHSAPISITRQSFIRAAAFLPGYVPSDVDTHSYIFLSDVLRQSNNIPGYPTVWTQASYPADYAMDSNIVQHPIYGQTISNDLRSIPTLSIVMDHASLWNSSTGIYPNPTSVGPAWERATSLELIRGDGATEFATTSRIQMHGNASRDNQRTPKHAFGLNFNSAYGPAKLRYDWFGGGVAVHDKIVLRNCGFVDGWAGRYADEGTYTNAETGEVFRGLRYRPETTCYLRDAWVKDSFRAMGWAASRSQYVHLYLNGLYWGLYEPSEHVDESYFNLIHGGNEGAWDVLVGEDNNGPPVIVAGSGKDWTNVLNLVNAGVTNLAGYQAVDAVVDIDNLIDYMLLHIFAESEDWPRHNWYLAHRRATNGVPGTKFVFTVWDQELTLDRLVRRNRIDVGGTGGEVYSPARVYQQLRAWPDFRVRFGDRVQKHLFNGGALTSSNTVARLLASASIISNALVGESARWGDARKYPTPGSTNGTGQTFTRNEWWQPEIDKLATNFLQKLTADNVARFRAGNLYPALSAPEFNQFGGAVPAGFALTLGHTNPAGTIFFTTDGADPRVVGSGAVAPTALAFDQPVTLNSPTLARARVLNGTNWSALLEAMFYPPQDLSRLVLSEIMYNPPALGATDGDEFEFLELKNTGTNALNLSGLTFSSGISFTFSNGTWLAPDAFFVLVRNTNAFASKYPGVIFDAVYAAQLNNGGEKLALSHPFAGEVFSVTYGDAAPWPVTADGHGFSLVQRSAGATQAPDDGSKWRASSLPGGSPGADDPETGIARIVINEALSAGVPPQADTIELFNPAATNADIGGWFLSDDPGVPRKFRIPDGTSIPAQGYIVFDETAFNPTPGTNGSFALGANGDAVYLFSGDAGTNLTGYSHGFSFAAAAVGVSFGRCVNSVGEEQFPAQISLTFSNANSGPRVGPVVINEIQYHPSTADDPFVEVKNITGAAVALFDEFFPSNTWRLNGIGFDFPTNFTLEAGGLALLVATNPADFRTKYGVPETVPVFGPYLGSMQWSGERLALERPAPPTTNGVSYIVVDAVRYNDKAPWPPAADGGGASLQRVTASAYGDDPINWLADVPTPGRERPGFDSDGDGMPDEWETRFALDPQNPADAGLDPDHDGLTNLQEYLAGTDPRNPASVLRIEMVGMAEGGDLTFGFTAVSNRSYAVQFRHSSHSGIWSNLFSFPPAADNRFISVTNSPAGSDSGFYRLVTPAQ